MAKDTPTKSPKKKPRARTKFEKYDPINGQEFFTTAVDRYQKELARKNSLALREKMRRKK